MLLLLTTSAWPCLQHSRNLGTTFLHALTRVMKTSMDGVAEARPGYVLLMAPTHSASKPATTAPPTGTMKFLSVLCNVRGQKEPSIAACGSLPHEYVRGSAERWSPGCVNVAGKARHRWSAKFTQLGDHLFAKACTVERHCLGINYNRS